VQFEVDFETDFGPLPTRQAEEATEIMESAAHFFALAATPATQLGGRRC
jgi:hypothetical protein